MPTEFLPLPKDDDRLILRKDVPLYGGPAKQTLAKWASRPSESPCPLPYVLVGRQAAYTVRILRRLQQAMTFRHSAERMEAQRARRAAAA